MVTAAELALLHQRSEGWTAALQMAALSLRGATDPARVARALEVRCHAIAEYFVDEVLEQQPPEVAQFMLDTSVLGELTAQACAAVTARPDAAVLLHGIDAANLFLVALDDERTSFRYHHLVHQVLHAELRARDPARERALQLRAAEWFESTRETRRATRHFLAARQADRALGLLQERVVPDFLRDPVLPSPLDLSTVDPAPLADALERLLGVAADLLFWGDADRGGRYLDLLEQAQPPIPAESGLAARFAALRAFRRGLLGQLDEAVAEALAARVIQERNRLTDEWSTAVSLILLRDYTCQEDYEAVEREAAAALAIPGLPEPARLVLVPGARALASFEVGYLAEAGAAIGRGDPAADSILGGALHTARRGGFVNTVVTTAPQVTSHLIEHSARQRPDPFVDLLIAAAMEVRAAQPRSASGRALAEPLTEHHRRRAFSACQLRESP